MEWSAIPSAESTRRQRPKMIGLSLSRSIIQAHRAVLWASASKGPGSAFVLPIFLEAANRKGAGPTLLLL